jgi:hypothetical protein
MDESTMSLSKVINDWVRIKKKRTSLRQKSVIVYITKVKGGYSGENKPRNSKKILAIIYPDGSVLKRAKHKETR